MGEARVIDGKAFAEGLRRRVATETARLERDKAIVPGLAVVLVGDNPASQVYVRSKSKQASECGIAAFDHALPADASEAQLAELIARLNADPAVHGILVQLPLPKQIDADRIMRTIDPNKDVDGFHPINVGLLASGRPRDAFVPCTPRGCLMLLEDTLGDLSGLHAVVLGRSTIVGRPMAQLLLAANCTVTIAHSKTRDLAGHCRRADILVAAIGQPEFVRGDMIAKGATVIDVGITRLPGEGGKARLVGDVAFAEAKAVAGAITPVPGGIGPMTIACLLANTVTAACRRAGVAAPEWWGKG
jgi:methylenetetrahydrofolate dehydrogenase (NADP+)/methenyltetrahydrofolate cyclohydrolase